MSTTTQYRLDDPLRFGRYEGRELWRVIEQEPEYVRWCLRNLDHFDLDDEAFAAYKKEMERRHYEDWEIV